MGAMVSVPYLATRGASNKHMSSNCSLKNFYSDVNNKNTLFSIYCMIVVQTICHEDSTYQGRAHNFRLEHKTQFVLASPSKELLLLPYAM